MGLCRMDVSCLSKISPGEHSPVGGWMLEQGSETVACWKSCGVIPLLLPLPLRRAGVGFLATSSWMMEVAQPWDCHQPHGARAGAVSHQELGLLQGVRCVGTGGGMEWAEW